MRKGHRSSASLIVGALLMVIARALCADSTLIEFDIPQQPLGSALQLFAKQLQQPVSFDNAALGGARSNAISGRFTAEEAMARLLKGTGVDYRRGRRGVWIVGSQRALATAASDSSPVEAASAAMVEPARAVEIETVVVSASRTPQVTSQTSSSVTVVSTEDMAAQLVENLRSSLAQHAGVTVITTGRIGGETSVYLRGAYPHHTLFIVDGVRMNDREANYGSFMGAADLGGVSRVEVLRGPQSPMYGSAAMGGVVLMDSVEFTRDVGGRLDVTKGSFGTYSGSVSGTGSVGDVVYSVAAGYYQTDNDQPLNAFDNWNYSAHLSYRPSASLQIGMTMRGQDSEYESPGSRYRNSAGVADTANQLATLYARWYPLDTVSSRLIVGMHRREYLWVGTESISDELNKRYILDWQAAWNPNDSIELVAGINYENSAYEVGNSRTEDSIFAAFLSGSVRVSETLTLNAGVRNDEFDSVGGAFTWRTGVAWMISPETKLRATYGTGFAAPGSSDRYGVPAWGQLPNPDLVPEKSSGWDVGVDRAIAHEALTLSATYFENRFTNLIDWMYFDLDETQGTYVNRGRAETWGAELGLVVRAPSGWNVRMGYTYLEARDQEMHERLSRRPRHSFDTSTWIELRQYLTLGIGLRAQLDRTDRSMSAEDFVVARLFASAKVTDRILLKFRIENLFDEAYEEVRGYPALPRGVFAGAQWTF